jgi:hypothetical protein
MKNHVLGSADFVHHGFDPLFNWPRYFVPATITQIDVITRLSCNNSGTLPFAISCAVLRR